MTHDMWSRWVNLYKSFSDKDLKIAAPFIPYVPESFGKLGCSILYVGKATNGPCERLDFDAAVAEGLDAAREQSKCFSDKIFCREKVGGFSATFWGFARELSTALGSNGEALGNLAWSNICKIGAEQGNPAGILFDDQIPLAVESLEDEIATYKPSIIVCVANSFADPVLLPALGNPRKCDWGKSEEVPGSGVEGVWWLLSPQISRPVIWLRHPQGSSKELRTFAIAKSLKLTQP